ncbi:MAG TPA: RNA chaperone Hfq [Blastocatellia bacterium]|nr:RNA chaperone Hfq [Blastocatellia bacterium]
MEKASQNLQDSFLNMARRDRIGVTIYLMSGVKLTGRIRGFDKYSVILESGQQQQLIFKHAISTVALPRGVVYRFEGSAAEPDQEHAPGGPGHAPASNTPTPAAAPAQESAPSGGGSRQGES